MVQVMLRDVGQASAKRRLLASRSHVQMKSLP
jgi:hypothetical protein